MCRLSGKLLTAARFYLNCVSCSICLLGGLSTLRHRIGQLSAQTLHRVERHSNFADLISPDRAFTLRQDSLAGLLLFGFEQTAEFQKRPLRVFDQARQFVSQSNLLTL